MWSGATSYQALCLAAKSEEKRQAKLQKRRQYKPKTDQVQWSVNAKPFIPSERGDNRMGMTKTSLMSQDGRGGKPKECWTCGKVGHLSRECRATKTESVGHSGNRMSSARVVQTMPLPEHGKSRDNPLQYLTSDSDSEDSSRVKLVHVHDRGSKPQCARVVV